MVVLKKTFVISIAMTKQVFATVTNVELTRLSKLKNEKKMSTSERRI